MATRNKAAGILKQLFAAYPNSQVSEGTVAVYIRLLADIEPTELQIVVDQCIAECKFLPTVAEIRERHRSITRSLTEITSAEAWGVVMAEIRRVGSWGSPHFEDARIAKVVEAMGWTNLCQSENPAVERAQFMRMYDAIAQREESVRKLLPQARTLAAHRGLIPIGDSLKALVDKAPEHLRERQKAPDGAQ